jgi:hypothetical protein
VLRSGVPRCLLTGLIGRQRFVLAETSDVECRHWPLGEYLELPRHGIWCRHASAESDFLELLLDEIDDGFFRFAATKP